MTPSASVIVYETSDDVRAARWELMRRAEGPVWKLRRLHADRQLSDQLQTVLAGIDELDWLAAGGDPVASLLNEYRSAVDDDVLAHAGRIRADFFAVSAGPRSAAVVGRDLVLTWANYATVWLGDGEFAISAPGVDIRGPIEDVHEKLEANADRFGVTQYRPATAAEKLERIRKLYQDACAATAQSCSDDLELFLVDLSLALGV